mgnify:CR=1 FL=1
MSNVRFIGDIHCNYNEYLDVAKRSIEPTVQVGDFGMGFYSYKDAKMNEWLQENPKHRFIRGNHDNLNTCLTSPGFIKDGLIENNIMYVGGAWSIDRAHRVEGQSWWADEELSSRELYDTHNVYNVTQPEIMVTHDCPLSVSEELFIKRGKAIGKDVIPTRTGQAFEAMFSVHQPKIWIFGHWHHNRIEAINGTIFICLTEMNDIVIDTDTATIIGGINAN